MSSIGMKDKGHHVACEWEGGQGIQGMEANQNQLIGRLFGI